jgi:hypothetical protein
MERDQMARPDGNRRVKIPTKQIRAGRSEQGGGSRRWEQGGGSRRWEQEVGAGGGSRRCEADSPEGGQVGRDRWGDKVGDK